MQDFEKELCDLKLAPPPKWLKARAMVSAANAAGRVARRRKYMTIALAAAASIMIAVGVGYRFLGAFGILAHGGSPIQATGVQSFAAPGLLDDTATSGGIKSLGSNFNELGGTKPSPAAQTPSAPQVQSTSTAAESTAAR